MVSRREFLTIGAGGVAAAALTSRAAAQTPKRGGALSLRTWDPPHFDQILAHAYKTHVAISFTHSRLLRHKAGPGVRPGALAIEGDLAESWQQTSETTYVFNGLAASMCFATYGSTQLVDTMQLLLKDLKSVGIGAALDQKEYGAYQATCRLGKFDSMVFGPLTPFLEPDSFLFGQYYSGEPRNRSHVADPALGDLLVRQRRVGDLKSRREAINHIERHLAKQQYYVQAPSGTYVGVWDAALKNYGPDLGFDYGGRLMAAWLDR